MESTRNKWASCFNNDALVCISNGLHTAGQVFETIDDLLIDSRKIATPHTLNDRYNIGLELAEEVIEMVTDFGRKLSLAGKLTYFFGRIPSRTLVSQLTLKHKTGSSFLYKILINNQLGDLQNTTPPAFFTFRRDLALKMTELEWFHSLKLAGKSFVSSMIKWTNVSLMYRNHWTIG